MRGLVGDCNSLEWMHRTGLSRMPSALCVFNFTQLLSVARRGVTAPPRLCRDFLLPHSHGFWCIQFSWFYYFRPAQCFPAVALFFFFFSFKEDSVALLICCSAICLSTGGCPINFCLCFVQLSVSELGSVFLVYLGFIPVRSARIAPGLPLTFPSGYPT